MRFLYLYWGSRPGHIWWDDFLLISENEVFFNKIKHDRRTSFMDFMMYNNYYYTHKYVFLLIYEHRSRMKKEKKAKSQFILGWQAELLSEGGLSHKIYASASHVTKYSHMTMGWAGITSLPLSLSNTILALSDSVCDSIYGSILMPSVLVQLSSTIHMHVLIFIIHNHSADILFPD